jgi:hypothetical protein
MSRPLSPFHPVVPHHWFMTMDGVMKCTDCPVTREVYDRIQVHEIEMASVTVRPGDDDLEDQRYLTRKPILPPLKPPVSSLRVTKRGQNFEAGFWGFLVGLMFVLLMWHPW